MNTTGYQRCSTTWLSCLLLLTMVMAKPLCAEPSASFEVPRAGVVLELPRDHGSHPSFQTEWWYFTGQLVSEGQDIFGRQADYGFELTFFRRGEVPGALDAQAYLAHAAVTDITRGTFGFDRQMCSSDLGICGATEGKLQVWNHGWRVESFGSQIVLQYDLPATAERNSYSLRLVGEYPFGPTLHGDAGFSRKGTCPSCASYYYSLPGIPMRGHIEVGKQRTHVQGLVWMDHEYMSNSLQADQAGWDWFGLLFKNGKRLMLYRLRGQDGRTSYGSGTLIEGSSQRQLSVDEFQIEALSTWRNSRGVAYPSGWRVRVPSAHIDETVRPLLPQQEIVGEGAESVSYWEGAVRSENNSVLGYVELTGYDKPLGAKF